jgi:transcriptional regulator with XRE-family HTH domain
VKVACRLAEYRGDESLRHLATRAGISAGVLSQIEQGRALPRDRDIAKLEQAYGHPIETWYSPRTLIALREEEA